MSAQTASLQPGDILTWAEVKRIHPVRHGIHHRDGRLLSLLTDFGRFNPCYPDAQGASDTTIYYTGDGRRGDQRLTPRNQAMLAAIVSKHAVPLFNKLAAGRWQHLGYWQVTAGEHRFDQNENRMLWRFTLTKTLTAEQ